MAKKDLLCCVYNHNHNDNSVLWLNRLKNTGFETFVLDSGSKEQLNGKNIKQYDNIYYGGLFGESVKLLNQKDYKWLFFVCSDILIDEENFKNLVNTLQTIDNIDKLGIYQPSTTADSHNVWTNNFNRGCGLRKTSNIEGWMMLVRKDIIEELYKYNIDFSTEMKMGWGIDVLLSYISLRMGYKNMVDDNVIVTHPNSPAGYNTDVANSEMEHVFSKIGKTYNSIVSQCNSMFLKKEEPTLVCCLFNYKHDANTNRWFNILNTYYDVYVIDTFHKDNGSVFEGNVPYTKIHYLNNVYWGGSYIEAYRILCECNAKYLLTVDTDIEIDVENAEKMLRALDIFETYDRIGVYTGTLKIGSKALGSTQVTITNCHLYNHGMQRLRDVHGIEGWLNVMKKEVMDDIFPYLKLPDNKYGWGVPPACIRRAIKKGLRVVADDRYEVFHPAGVAYNNVEAQEEENRFKKRYIELGCLLPEEEQEIINKMKI